MRQGCETSHKSPPSLSPVKANKFMETNLFYNKVSPYMLGAYFSPTAKLTCCDNLPLMMSA